MKVTSLIPVAERLSPQEYVEIKKRLGISSKVVVDCARPAPPAPVAPAPPAPVTVKNIQHVVAREFGILVFDMLIKCRNKKIIIPRHIAMYIARELTDLSLPRIGQFFGGYDHTTVLYAIRRISQLRELDPEIDAMINKIVAQFSVDSPSRG